MGVLAGVLVSGRIGLPGREGWLVGFGHLVAVIGMATGGQFPAISFSYSLVFFFFHCILA